MNSKISTFQMVVFGFLGFSIVLGVIIFSLHRAGSGERVVDVVAWGTISQATIDSIVDEINTLERNSLSLTYRELSPAVFEAELIEALASGGGPDLVFMTNDLIVKHQNKLYTVSYESYSQRDFKNNFIEAADVLLTENGLIGFPYIIDPLVLYWNRAMLNSAGISRPPSFWNQILGMAQQLTRVDENLRIQKAGIALGEFRNIKNAKDILVALTQQSGSDIIVRNTNPNIDGNFANQMSQNLGFANRPTNAALGFYTQFSNPSLNTYSWNRSLPNSEEMFLAGDLAFYVGYASEFPEIRRRNPNLNFDVAVLPQSDLSNTETGTLGKRTLGRLAFIGIVKNTKNLAPAFRAATMMTNNQNINLLREFTNLPPVRRDLLSEPSSNAILQVFYESALIARPFLDPDSNLTNQIFLDMVESYTSGRAGLGEVVNRADSQISGLLR